MTLRNYENYIRSLYVFYLIMSNFKYTSFLKSNFYMGQVYNIIVYRHNKFSIIMTYMDDTKTKIIKEIEIFIILIIIFLLSLLIIWRLSNIVYSQFLHNLFISIMFGFLGIFVYFAIIETINIKDLLSAFLMNTLSSFLFFSMLNNAPLELFVSFYMVFVLTPLTLGIIFNSITKDTTKKITTFIAILPIAVFISPTPFTFLSMLVILSAVILPSMFILNKIKKKT